MDALLAGYRRFREGSWAEQSSLYAHLSEKGQKPKALVVACVDSRVDPSRIFDAGPGELLIIRNVANLVPPYAPDGSYHGTSAALEFGVRVLEIPNLIVLGHGLCGGVKTLLKGDDQRPMDFVSPWMSLASRARDNVLSCYEPAEQQMACEQEVVRLSLANLVTYPWVKSRVDAGSLMLHGGWFSIADGALKLITPDGEFAAISPAA